MNNSLLLLLPFLMNNQGGGNMTGLVAEMMKSQKNPDPMMLMLFSMMNGKEQKKPGEGTEAVKGFGGSDVENMLKLLLTSSRSS